MHYVDVRNRQRIVLIKKKRLRTTSDSSSSEACEPNDPPTVRSALINEEQSRKQLADGAGKLEVTGNVCQLPDCCGSVSLCRGTAVKGRGLCVSAAHSLLSPCFVTLQRICFVLETRSHYARAGFNLCSRCPSRVCWNCGHVPQPLPYNLLFTSSEMVTRRNLSRRYMGILCAMKMTHKFKIST